MLKLLEWILAIGCGFGAGMFVTFGLIGFHVIPIAWQGWDFFVVGVILSVVTYFTVVRFLRSI